MRNLPDSRQSSYTAATFSSLPCSVSAQVCVDCNACKLHERIPARTVQSISVGRWASDSAFLFFANRIRRTSQALLALPPGPRKEVMPCCCDKATESCDVITVDLQGETNHITTCSRKRHTVRGRKCSHSLVLHHTGQGPRDARARTVRLC